MFDHNKDKKNHAFFLPFNIYTKKEFNVGNKSTFRDIRCIKTNVSAAMKVT